MAVLHNFFFFFLAKSQKKIRKEKRLFVITALKAFHINKQPTKHLDPKSDPSLHTQSLSVQVIRKSTR